MKSFDAFLSYNSEDRLVVEEIERRLRAKGLTLFLEVRELPPGREYQPALAEALRDSKTCVICLGPNGLGPWQKEELQSAIDMRVRDPEFHVIPVLLPGSERPRRGDVAHLDFLINASWVEFLKTLDDEAAFRRLVWGIKGEKPEEKELPPETGICPYRGLEAFGPDDAKYFFGRQNLTDWLVSDLRREVKGSQEVRMLAVLGPSGSGKSSVVLAGLIPRLKDGAIDGSEHWPVAITQPGDDPLVRLTEKVVPIGRTLRPDPAISEQGEQDDLLGRMRADNEEAAGALSRYVGLKFADEPKDRRLVIVVDQFEEIFTYLPDEKKARERFESTRASFIANLLHAARTPRGRVAVVLTMRSDFLGQCVKLPQLNDTLNDHLVQIGPMRREELREAIERPAYLSGCEVEPALTEKLLADVAAQPGALPLLQFALTEVWKKREVRKLTLQAYNALGGDKQKTGIEGAIELRANEIYNKLPPDQQEVCRQLFLRLVQPGEGTEDTKRRVPFRELHQDDPDRAASFRQVIQALSDAENRLITTAGDKADGAVEVAHEALIRGWGLLREWIDKDRAGLRTHRRLTEAAKDWSESAPEDKDAYLYTGARLAAAEEWADAHPNELAALESTFLSASREAQRQRERKELDDARRLQEAEQKRADEAVRAKERQERLGRRLLVSATVAFLLAVVASGLGWWANEKRIEADSTAKVAKANEEDAKIARDDAIASSKVAKAKEQEAEVARTKAVQANKLAESRRLAAESQLLPPRNLDLSMLLAVEAMRTSNTLQARRSLQRVLDERPEVGRFLHIPEGWVSSVAYGPDGRIAAGYYGRRDNVDGVVILEPDLCVWLEIAERVANRNLTWEEWERYFPDRTEEEPYRRTVRSFPWPHDLPEEEKQRAEAWELKNPEKKCP